MTCALSSGYLQGIFGINAAIVYYKQKRQFRQLVELPFQIDMCKILLINHTLQRLPKSAYASFQNSSCDVQLFSCQLGATNGSLCTCTPPSKFTCAVCIILYCLTFALQRYNFILTYTNIMPKNLRFSTFFSNSTISKIAFCRFATFYVPLARHPLVVLCLSFGEVPIRFRSGSDEVPMRFRWRQVASKWQ